MPDLTDQRAALRKEPGGRVKALRILWCAPGFLHNDWAHALKYLRMG